MNFPDPIFNTKMIKQFVNDLITYYEYTQFNDLSYCDKCQFAALMIEATGMNSECLVELNDLSRIIERLKKSLSGNHEDDEDLLSYLKESVISYYSDTMEALFNYHFENFQREKQEWFDYIGKYGNPDESYDTYRENI